MNNLHNIVAEYLPQIGTEFKVKPMGCGTTLDGWRHFDYRTTFVRNGFKYNFSFKQGMAHTKYPTAADVLYCLLMESELSFRSFEEWADEMGYLAEKHTLESWKNAKKNYLQVKRNAKKIERLFQPSEVSKLKDLLSGF